MFSIGDLARRTGVGVTTIRYYEGLGLIVPEERTAGNQRRYTRAGLDRLGFISHARALGLPLGTIRELIALDPANHAETHKIATGHLADLRGRIARLRRLEAELERIVASCDGGPGHVCDILAALGDHGGCDGAH